MAQLTVPKAPKEYTTQYEMLLGVDYQADQTQVDRRRSPDMVNMISDFGGNPIKRDGYRIVDDNYASIVMVDDQMYGIYRSVSLLSIRKIILDGYEFRTIGTPDTLVQAVGAVKNAFAFQQYIFIICEKCIVRYDTEKGDFTYVGIGNGMMSVGTLGESAPLYEENIPDVVIGLKPDGTGGTAYDDKNLLSIYQRVMYAGDGATTAYKIPNYTKMGTYVKAEIKDANGDWQTATVTVGASTAVTGKTLDGSSTMTNNIVDATVTFSTAPAAPAVTGEDNVRITYCPYKYEEASSGVYKGYYDEHFVSILGYGVATFQNGRLFIGDKYRVYYSDVNDPFTLSDLNWFEVDNKIMCFTRTSNYLAIITEDNGRNTIFLASEENRTIDQERGTTETYFKVRASNAGIGAVAKKCIATLSDEPMFLSNTGIFGIQSNFMSEKYAINRSSRINRRLMKEQNLDNAVGIAFNDYFYCAINGQMYVLDGRHKESDRAGNKPLEAYYFNNMPAIEEMYVVGDRMYFADDEHTYTWNDDLTELERYYDNGHILTVIGVQYQIGDSQVEPPTGEWLDEKPTPEEGEYLWYKATYDDATTEITIEERAVDDTKFTGTAVASKWCSTFDDDGAPQRLKTLMKKGSMVTIVPHFKSGCEITLVKDGDVFEYLGSFDADIQSFDRIEFSRLSFSSNAVAFDKFTKKKIKKYKRLQIQIANNKAEPFGLTQITKTYTFGNYAKR